MRICYSLLAALVVMLFVIGSATAERASISYKAPTGVEIKVSKKTGIDTLPMPAAVAYLTETVCLPGLKDRSAMKKRLPKQARVRTNGEMANRLTSRPRPGKHWIVDSLEGPILIGSIKGSAGGCQILAVTPFANAFAPAYDSALAQTQDAFQPTTEFGSGTEKDGVTWTRYKSKDHLYLDTMVYALKGRDAAATIHVIVKP